MKLIDLLELANENTKVVVCNSEQETLSEYDGKNSIEDCYNNYEVSNVYVRNNKLYVVIPHYEISKEDREKLVFWGKATAKSNEPVLDYSSFVDTVFAFNMHTMRDHFVPSNAEAYKIYANAYEIEAYGYLDIAWKKVGC